MKRVIKRFELWIGVIAGLLLVVAAGMRWVPYSLTETLGFVTGIGCVYLVVRQSIWNFPVGIANNIFFLVLFVNARLFGDAGLQLVYIVLGLHGWYCWLRGGKNREVLLITRASPRLLVVAGCFIVVGTACLVLVLRLARGAAPALDSFTTMLSLVAQYLLNRKALENWFLWIAADVVYIWLYVSRDLYLTALLYFVFLCLCVAGWLNWRKLIERQTSGVRDVASAEAVASD